MTLRRLLLVGLLLAVSVVSVSAEGDAPRRPEDEVHAATYGLRTVEERTEALARLAWTSGAAEPDTAAVARLWLVDHGHKAIPTLRKALHWVKPEQQADVVKAVLAIFRRQTTGIPAGYLGALEEAIWFGTREARLLAIPEVAGFRYTPAMMTIIDAAVEDPELLPAAVPALGRLGDDRARFFLEKVMTSSDAEARRLAADALSRIGGRATLPLKAAMRSEDRDLRTAALRALLPRATVDDLSALHEYVYAHPDDDPDLVAAAREAALEMERVLAAQQAADSASPMPE